MLHLSNIGGLSSTLVETVSLDVDNFSESFLTCGTCLLMYNGSSRSPKLLGCSHTVCLECARTLAEGAASADGAARPRCPVCAAAFVVPPAGVVALPPSFLVNQLLDLMSSAGRRDVIPKCAQHVSCELLFCETCDTVFCAECDLLNDRTVHNSSSASALTSSTAAHNVVPFAIAIRRVSEIVQYKATQCARNLEAAATAVEREIRQLDEAAERCVDTISQAFTELGAAIEQRRNSVISMIHSCCQDKTQVLEEQLALIAAERERAQAVCHEIPPDICAITARITKLNELLDSSTFLGEPRENSFIQFNDSGIRRLSNGITSFGAIRTSETFPALCTVEFAELSMNVNLSTRAYIVTYDASGCRRNVGGDPVSVGLVDCHRKPVAVMMTDIGDGRYEVMFTPLTPGTHSLTVRIFDRVVGTASPISFTANEFHSSIATFAGLHQPVAVAMDDKMLYVLDTGNSRVAVYGITACMPHVQPTCSIINESLTQRGATGMSFIHDSDGNISSLFVVNWRTARVSSFTTSGSVSHSFDCEDFIEPTSLTIARDRTIFVADNGLRTVFVFAPCGELLRKIVLEGSGRMQSELITCVYASPHCEELLVCDQYIRAFSYVGELLYQLPAGDSKPRGQYGGVVVDSRARYLASRSERGRSIIQVFSSERRWMFSIECDPDCRLRRPSGLAVDDSGHVYVADLGNNCVRKFRYV